MTKLFFSAGDLSGDHHCSLLIKELLKRHPDWKITALGGRRMAEAGAEILGDTSELGVIGFASALAILPQTLKLRARAVQWMKANQPDAIVMCDWGGFNGRVLPYVNPMGIPVLYYFPPRSWQKRGEGGLSVVPFCQQIATPFEWSAKRLNDAGGKADWVGHPILETMQAAVSREAVRTELGIGLDEQLVVVLPGSRALERKVIAPHIAGAIAILKGRFPTRFVVAATRGSSDKLRPIFGNDVQIVEDRTFDLLRACDAAIVKSGTSTLEAAVADAPQVIVYDVPALLHAQVQLTGLQRKIPFVGMPNIILERSIVPELLGHDCRAQKIADAMAPLLENRERVSTMRADYSLIREALGERLPYTATNRTAELVENLVAQR